MRLSLFMPSALTLAACVWSLFLATLLGNRAGGWDEVAEQPLQPLTLQGPAVGEKTLTLPAEEDSRDSVHRFSEPFAGDQFFVHFRLRYSPADQEAGRGDTQPSVGESFSLWFDEQTDSGNDHRFGVPNVGLTPQGVLVRYGPGSERTKALAWRDGKTHWVVVRIWKSIPGEEQPFDSLDVWLDPEPDEETKPDVWISSRRTIARIAALGFTCETPAAPLGRLEVIRLSSVRTWSELGGLSPRWIVPIPAELWRVEEPPAKTIVFSRDVLPLLQRRCFHCHSGPAPSSGHRLDVLDEVLTRALPGSAVRSDLVHRVSSDDAEMRMPPPDAGAVLTAEEVDVLRRWIDEGLDWDEASLPTPVPTTDHWSFQPLKRPPVPRPKSQAWRNNPIDAFIAARHEQQGIVPNSPADDRTLQRRIALDLTGLNLQVTGDDDFASGNVQPGNVEQVFETLIHSDAYGEHWGRHWLDLARWSESNGHQHNRRRPHAWRYRDYVVASFRDHKPYDQFLREQLCGGDSDEALVATGFLAAARYSGNELDKQIQRNDILTDVTNTVSSAVLGLTVECAQCHSHKFDPISLSDYYRLQAFFAAGQPGNVVLSRGEVGQTNDVDRQTLIDRRWQILDSVRARAEQNLRKRDYPEPVAVIQDNVVAAMTRDERTTFFELDQQIRQLPQAWAWHDSSSAQPVAPHDMQWPLPRRDYLYRVHVLARGNIQYPGPAVAPAWPAVFDAVHDERFAREGPRTRRDLVDWLTLPSHPLTARVWVNRIWQGHFGRGLVATPSDFGTQGSRPSHPQLLDWLASELIASDWQTQHIQRLIVTSRTYQLSSDGNPSQSLKDPDNVYLWRHVPRRLEAEMIRDNILRVAGMLDSTVGGPSVRWTDAENATRRSLYLEQKRNAPYPHEALFDGAKGVASCARRKVSTAPLQSLYLLNSQFTNHAAAQWASRLQRSQPTISDRVRSAYRQAWGREPDEAEVTRGVAFVNDLNLKQFCLVLLNSNEFIYTR